VPIRAAKPTWQTNDHKTVKIYQGDVRDVVKRLPSKSVQCIVTSPPYWALRDYGAEGQIGSEPIADCYGWTKQDYCDECHVCVMTTLFQEISRVLRDDGTL